MALQLLRPLAALFAALTFCVFPALPLVRRIPSLDPLEKLSVAVFANLAVMFLVQWTGYLLSWPEWVPAALLLATAATGLAATVALPPPDGSRPGRGVCWDGVLVWAALAAWIVALQSGIVVYGAVSWFGDWHEHYERALFFLDRLPPRTLFLNDTWTLPARGPLFNAAAALLMAPLGREFWSYQIVSTVLNTAPVLTVALLFRRLARLPRWQALLLSFLLLALAPFAVQQETYTWTKFLTVGYILGALHFALRSREDRTGWAAGCGLFFLAAGILAHYMTVPFAVLIGADLLPPVWRYRRRKAVAAAAALSVVLLGAWFIYLFRVFGVKPTLTANSTLGGPEAYRQESPTDGRLNAFAENLYTTFVPYGWRHGQQGFAHAAPVLQRDRRFQGETSPAPEDLNRRTEWLSDLVNDQDSLLGNLGWTGLFSLALAAFWSGRFGKPGRTGEEGARQDPGWKTWAVFFTAGIPLNIATVPDFSPHGLAHINLQPFVVLTAAFLAARLRTLPPVAKGVLSLLALVEAALNTGALIALEQRPVPLALQAGRMTVTGVNGTNSVYVNNYLLKLETNAVFLSDKLQDLWKPFCLTAAVLAAGLCAAGLLAGRRLSKEEE